MNRYYNPVRVYQGPKSIQKIPRLLGEMDLSRGNILLLAYDAGVFELSPFRSLAENHPDLCLCRICFKESNPTVEQLYQVFKSTAAFCPDVVIAVGGGSILDVGKSLCCLYGKEIPDAGSLPTAEIIKAFPDENLNSDVLHTNGDFFEAVSYSGSHQAGLQAVIKGDIDVAPISDQILASEIANGNAAEGDVKVIHESGAIPAEAMVVAESVSQETRDKLTDFLTAYDNEEYFTQVIKKEGARFIACDITDYEPIIELNNIINNEEA